MKKLYIPEPCSENWESMSPQEKGRLCSACNKCVIDFTQKKPQEIQQIIEEKKEEQICGRFYNHQLKMPDPSEKLKERFFTYIPSYLQNTKIAFLLFSFVLFLIGCSKPKEEVCMTTGLVDIIEEDSTITKKDYVMGEPMMIDDDTVAKIPKKDSAVIPKKHSTK
ncbi:MULTISPECIES: hypothetical protein [unclassified Chryseobacterium]|uniref:hypothetical protein n=1 Tax=unclassified Chryseobacterium TaxID=2593645 RepID=UPI00100BC750|nr:MULTISPECIES: hypothetical protein [unclassified Chryseobacterium]RXM52643.1 hypothetical protein BOQ64_07255 [Chryseobacterium sp. CH25]RXM66700.1 hypothetical protein BOQ60_01730 [Chryseobacterium sp. CH1]